ncbi:80cd6532-9d7f-4fa3-bb68-de2949bee57c [Thermothielavioides terrestris]|uniref:GPI inositol-deacylase n=1 Tax=Thermothielavioides terrestris TaxID=2587410 RepID=A0A3S4F643_9PEZI|nr:80cd6532-9d7f-4fa3-bb68-de2949bee57c [Thermothielavioides terrestris]
MERLVESGKARAIGLSNFNILKTKRILEVARIIPAVNQVEIHPYFPQRELLEFSSRHGILLMAHQPLGGRPVTVVRAHSDEPFPTEDPTVCLSWAVQRGIPVIPKSVQEEHMKQNLQLKRLPDDAFRAVDDITLKRRPIRFLDPSRHLGFDIFDEDNDQPHEFLAVTASQMDQSHKRPFSGFLSRSGTDKSVQRGFVRTDTASSFLSVAASSLDLSDDEKGPLGLTTLYEPPPPATPVADIVFIHGLGGGSRKTWSYSPEPRHYWPQSWLPQDEDFADVRIHTYGYKADWGGRRQTVLDTHDFAQSLLGALRNHPAVRRSRTRIILVGHSMGGSVAKKAYILARQDPTAADLGARVHSMFFLATPHRGSDMATVLENMLAVAWGHKRFVSDLAPNSAALTAINDAFRHFAPELRLWSFYETLPTRGVNRIVVERHLATLGYHNEEVASMDADHRHVCKFDTPADPNYKVLRNALVSALDMIRSTSGADPERSHGAAGERDQPGLHQAPSVSASEAIAIVRSFLGVREPLEGDLATLQVLKQPGSCEWFTKKTCFTAWRDGTAPGILWLVGRPAAGKSVLACHVIEQLTLPHALCSYFICKHAKAGESTLSECFRSLAFQMAMQDSAVMVALLQLARDDLSWDKSDESSVWRRLFTNCIFKLPSTGKHFWVIDGLDECSNFGAVFTKRLLASLPQHLRLFGTSRNLEEIERGLTSLGASRASVQVLSDTDTIEDMRLFLSTRLSELGRPETAEDRERMCEKILRKATGSFLWARLVLQEFEDAWTEEAMDAILREIPADLSALYARMVQSIQADRRKLPLAKSILTWVVLASRPLTVDELRCAVKLDTNQTLQNAAKAIPDLCGQLVFIDQHDSVHMIHETAREFLLSETGGLPLSMQKKRDHTRVASLLLKYLSSGVLKPLQGKAHQGGGRPRGFAKPAVTAAPADTSLLEYACAFFSEHLYRATSSDDLLMDELSDFLGTHNVLSWIEHIAAGGDLTPLSRTAMNLREYLGRRMKYVPPTDRSVQLVDGWVTDLIRVAAKFRPQLLDCPSSIHSLIPSLCPSESTISRTPTKDARQSSFASTLTVKGLAPGSWDDCLIRMDFHKGQTTAVRHGVRYFAIGLSTGQISLYDPPSIQVLQQLNHPERVRILEFSPDDLLLASCGTKHITVWDPKVGTMVSSFELQSPPLAVTFIGVDELLGAFRSCELIKWNLQTKEQECISWKQKVDSQGGNRAYNAPEGIVPASPPSVAAFLAIDGEVLLAVGYRAHPILVWNALELQLLGFCEPDIANNGIDAMVFSPNPDLPALLVALQGGSLCIFDYVTMEMLCRRPDVYANSVACSSDGRSVIIGSSQGLIEVFELEQTHNGAATTLNVIYRSNHPLDGRIVGVAFSADGLRFVDVRGQQGRVWAPAALVRKIGNELESSIGTSEADAALLLPPKPTRGMLDSLADPVITTHLIPSADGKFIVAGKSNGDVVLFSTADAAQAGILYRHARDASIQLPLGLTRGWWPLWRESRHSTPAGISSR